MLLQTEKPRNQALTQNLSYHPHAWSVTSLLQVLSDEPPMASVCAVTDAVVLSVPTAELGRLIEQVPGVLAKARAPSTPFWPFLAHSSALQSTLHHHTRAM